RRLFPYRTCNRVITGKDPRPCFYYHIKRCAGPCIGAVSREEYRALIERACLFLEGRQEAILQELEEEMQRHAEALRFERAARLRDDIAAIKQVVERQRIVSAHLNDHDFIAMARDDGQACVQVFFVRGGKLIGREYYMLTGTQDENESAVMASFVKQFYDQGAYVPPEILVPTDLDELAVIQDWLHQKRGTKVTVEVPRQAEKRGILNMAIENASATLAKLRAEWEADRSKHVEALAELQAALDLPNPPSRIECFDISNIQGTAATGSMVVFVQGAPSKGDYRRFRIKSVEGADDYASMAEVVRRRFGRARRAEEGSAQDRESRWALRPDLLIVDGGKGQLNAARAVMEELGVDDIPTMGMAKGEEALFLPERSDPIHLPADSQGLYLLQRIRDEAHRFAITYHRQLRRKAATGSALEDVPGIGPKRRKALLAEFGSLDGIRQASIEELAAVSGMTRSVAERLHETL
ncbi:MAG: excinuclease ABC subunit UvrC, partial [Anaerolineae bacterium]|nr:excinuclease ABC subunit UvrC [Anaerolineae bacterium]